MTDDSSKGYRGPSIDERLVRECEKSINAGQYTLNKKGEEEGCLMQQSKNQGVEKDEEREGRLMDATCDPERKWRVAEDKEMK